MMTNFIYKNQDCMEGMKEFPDKFFDLAIVDPPYGIGAGSLNFANGTSKNKGMNFKENDWDVRPQKDFFDELNRCSTNQIIWGGNYFANLLLPSRGWIVWDKQTGDNSYADAELAYTTFDSVVKIFRQLWLGSNAKDSDGRYHPTQKPIGLYKWLLSKYAKPNDKILDTHVGSGSSIIACLDMGFDVWGFELDKDYYASSMKRINNFLAQQDLFRT